MSREALPAALAGQDLAGLCREGGPKVKTE